MSHASKRWGWSLALLALLAIAVAGVLELRADRASQLDRVRQRTGGNPERGRAVIVRSGCGTCHQIAGIAGASGLVGPPLRGISSRVYLAGRLPNSADNLTLWIREPKRVDPMTAMPDVGLSERDARDVVAYLYAHN